MVGFMQGPPCPKCGDDPDMMVAHLALGEGGLPAYGIPERTLVFTCHHCGWNEYHECPFDCCRLRSNCVRCRREVWRDEKPPIRLPDGTLLTTQYPRQDLYVCYQCIPHLGAMQVTCLCGWSVDILLYPLYGGECPSCSVLDPTTAKHLELNPAKKGIQMRSTGP